MMPTMIEPGTHSVRQEPMIDDPPSSDAGVTIYEVTLVGTLTQLATRKWLIAKVTGVAMALGVIISLVLPNRYTAVVKLMPPQQAPSSALLLNQTAGGSGGALAGLAGGGLSALRSPNALYLGLLNSRPVADAIIQKFDLAKVYRAKDMTAARTKLARNTAVTSEKEGFISVSVTDTDKKRAAGMANAYTGELRILTQTLAVTEASQRRLFYEEQLKQAKDALISAEISFQQVQQSKGLVQLDAQTRAMIEGLAALRAQVAAKEVDLEAIRSYSTEHNPSVQLAERELSSLREQVARLEQRSHTSGMAGMGLNDIPGAGLEYIRADHELKYRQTMFDLLIKQYDAARLDEAKDAAIIQVLEPAIEPDRKSSPKRAQIILFSMLTGFLVSSLCVLTLWCKQEVRSDGTYSKRLRGLISAVTE